MNFEDKFTGLASSYFRFSLKQIRQLIDLLEVAYFKDKYGVVVFIFYFLDARQPCL